MQKAGCEQQPIPEVLVGDVAMHRDHEPNGLELREASWSASGAPAL